MSQLEASPLHGRMLHPLLPSLPHPTSVSPRAVSALYCLAVLLQHPAVLPVAMAAGGEALPHPQRGTTVSLELEAAGAAAVRELALKESWLGPHTAPLLGTGRVRGRAWLWSGPAGLGHSTSGIF